MNIQERIAQYVKLRDYKEAAKKEWDANMKRVSEAMSKLEGEFAEALNESGGNSINTDAGTCYKIERTSATVKDRDVFFKYAITERNFELMDIRANKKIVKELMDKGVEVPGIKFTASTQIGIRRGKDDE